MDNAKDIAYELQGGYQSTAQKVRDNIIKEYE
jgi:hypothetical protein